MFKKSIYFVVAIILTCSIATLPLASVQATRQPDNRRIVYTNGLDGHVISINSDGSGRQDYGPGFYPKLSPDGSKIAFSRDTTGLSARDLYVVHTDGSNERKVGDRVYTPGSSALFFSWAPDSTKLVFTSESGQSDPQTGSTHKQIATGHSDGTHLRQLTQDDVGVSNINPVWSPDNKYILYQHNADLYMMHSDGSNQRLAVSGASGGSWAPDASKILFSETGVGVRTATLDGANRVTLSPVGSSAVWSPDGSKIVMEAPNCGCDTEPMSIIMFNPDGSGKTVLAAPPSAGNVQHPVWSPDSKTVAYVEFASWQPARLVAKPINGGEASVVIVERVGYPEWAYTYKPPTSPPRHPSPWHIAAWLYHWIEKIWR